MLVELGKQEDNRLKWWCFGEARVVVVDEERPRRKMQAWQRLRPSSKGLSVYPQSLEGKSLKSDPSTKPPTLNFSRRLHIRTNTLIPLSTTDLELHNGRRRQSRYVEQADGRLKSHINHINRWQG